MRLTCPACGSTASLDALIGHEAARSILVRALEQTPVGKRLVRYIALFRPAQRQLSWDRAASLLGELLDMFKAGKVERHGRLWAAPEAAWLAALDEILARRDEGKLTLPLKSHGYLLEIITGQANKAEARAEQADHERRAGNTPVGSVASHQAFATQLVPIQREIPNPPRMSKAAVREKINQVKQQLTKGE